MLLYVKDIYMADEKDDDTLKLPERVFNQLGIRPGMPVCVTLDSKLKDI